MAFVNDAKKFWALVVSVVVATVAVILFFTSAVSNHSEAETAHAPQMAKLVEKHVAGDHGPLYKPQYPGDSVARAINDVKDFADNALREEAADSEKRYSKIDVKLDAIIASIGELKTQVAVLKVTRPGKP